MLRLTNYFLLGYLVLIWIFLIQEWISFGIGLGTIAFVVGIPVLVISMIIFLLLSSKYEKTKFLDKVVLCGGIFCCLLFTYYFTIGRGAEKRWDGQIFFF